MRLAAKAGAVSTVGLLLLVLAVAPGVADAAGPSPCARAEALLQAGRYTSAYAAYEAISPVGASCAKQGMAAAGALQAASQLITVGLVPQADAEIVKAVDADPTLKLPTALLTKTVAGRAVALARTLNADGFHQQAQQILLFVTEAHAVTALSPPVRAILASPGESAANTAGASAGGSALASIGHAIVSYGLWEAFVLLVVLILLARMYYPLTRRRLHLQQFTLVDADVGADAEHLRTRMREELQHLALKYARTGKGRRLRIDVAGPYDELQDIGSVLDQAPDPVKFIAALIGLLIRNRPGLCQPRLVTGALNADTEVRLGMATVDKTERNHVTIKHKDLGFPPVSPSAANPVAARYAQLALPAAAWVILTRYRKYRLGGTRNWASFTKFAVGYEWQQQGDTDTAEQYYLMARDADRENSTAAAVNLARLWQQREVLVNPGVVTGDHDWRGLLTRVAEATRSKTGDLQWYRSRYLLSLGLADRDTPGRGAADEEARGQARGLAVELAIEVMEQLRGPEGDVPKEFLENSQGPVLALAVSQMIPTTENVDEVITTGFVPDEVTDDDVLRELRKARDGGRVAPEVIVPYIEARPSDSETDLHLYRYELNRWQACEEAIAVIQEEALRPSGGDAERETILRERLEAATSAAGDARAALNRYAERLSRADDPVIRARVDQLTPSARRYGPPDVRFRNSQRWDRATPPTRFDGDPGIDDPPYASG